MQNPINMELEALLEDARKLASDVGDVVRDILTEGLREPLSSTEAEALLSRVVSVMRDNAKSRGDSDTVVMLDREAEALLGRVDEIRQNLKGHHDHGNENGSNDNYRVQLESLNDIEPRPVRPSPVFHERRVPVTEGFVRTRDIRLWDENERLDIHLNQFRQKYGRGPSSDELLSIMQGDVVLPGIEGSDQFEIKTLAKSIAVNGVRKAPIIDIDGTLLDGNRRVTACYYILNSPDFSDEDKRSAEWIKVWQLTEHATDEDREAVIVSLNFEPDFKQEWPKYVKAQKVYEDWERRLSLEPRADPTAARLREIRRDIARRFALATDEVSKFINMVGIAREFEDYHVVDRKKDQYASKHRAADKFEYFDELDKGKSAGGVNWCLNQEPAFKHVVFDLLYDNKFQNWRQIRDLKYVYQNDDSLQVLRKARDETDVETAQEEVDNAISIARMARAEQRQTGANTKIRVFTEWFLGLPVKAFDSEESGSVTQENLQKLYDALQLVEEHLKRVRNDS